VKKVDEINSIIFSFATMMEIEERKPEAKPEPPCPPPRKAPPPLPPRRAATLDKQKFQTALNEAGISDISASGILEKVPESENNSTKSPGAGKTEVSTSNSLPNFGSVQKSDTKTETNQQTTQEKIDPSPKETLKTDTEPSPKPAETENSETNPKVDLDLKSTVEKVPKPQDPELHVNDKTVETNCDKSTKTKFDSAAKESLSELSNANNDECLIKEKGDNELLTDKKDIVTSTSSMEKTAEEKVTISQPEMKNNGENIERKSIPIVEVKNEILFFSFN